MIFKNELLLSASKKSWRMSSSHGTEFDAKFASSYKKVWTDVWKRDDYKCHFCDFRSLKHQEIHHLNEDHSDNSPDNLVTVCPLCHQSSHLDSMSLVNGGRIIWLPEMSQQELNYICRSAFLASEYVQNSKEKDKSAIFKMAKIIESSFEERAAVVEQHIYQGASDPATFASALMDFEKDMYEDRSEYVKNFKLLHFQTRYPVQTKYWSRETFKGIPVESWLNLVPRVEPESVS